MYGQAPYVVNAALYYTEKKLRLRAGAVYNVVGPRITDVGARAADVILPDTEEQPMHSLNLVSSWGMSEHFKLKLKFKNVLLQQKTYKMGSFLLQRVDPGASVSLGVSYEH